MSELIAVGFKGDIHRASAILNRLCSMSDDWAFDLDDAIAIYRDENGNLKVDESYKTMIREETRLGALWGGFFGALLALPAMAGGSAAAVAGALAATTLGGGALGAASGAHDAKWWKKKPGIPEAFLKSVAIMLQPGDSAVLALLPAADPDMAEQFRGHGGTVLRTTLDEEQSSRLQATLNPKLPGG